MTNNVPSWIEELKQGDFLVIVFPYTGSTVYAEVMENSPKSLDSMYFGTITVSYNLNKIAKQEDLLYDDYSKDATYHDNWYAYRVT